MNRGGLRISEITIVLVLTLITTVLTYPTYAAVELTFIGQTGPDGPGAKVAYDTDEDYYCQMWFKYSDAPSEKQLGQSFTPNEDFTLGAIVVNLASPFSGPGDSGKPLSGIEGKPYTIHIFTMDDPEDYQPDLVNDTIATFSGVIPAGFEAIVEPWGWILFEPNQPTGVTFLAGQCYGFLLELTDCCDTCYGNMAVSRDYVHPFEGGRILVRSNGSWSDYHDWLGYKMHMGFAIIDETLEYINHGDARVEIDRTRMSVSEGGTSDSYAVVLGTEPDSNVVITAMCSDAQIDIGNDPGGSHSLTFTTDNWDTPQIVNVIAVNNDIYESRLPHITTITHSVQSGDPVYDDINTSQVEVWWELKPDWADGMNLMISNPNFEDGKNPCWWWGEILLEDDFEGGNFDKWTDGGLTDWDLSTSQYKSSSHSAHCSSSNNNLISDNLDTSQVNAIRISFWYQDDDIDNGDDVCLQLYDGSSYDDIDLTFPKLEIRFELGNTTPEDTWHFYRMTLYNEDEQAQYFHSNFRIKFKVSDISETEENLWVDDVVVEAGAAVIDANAHDSYYCARLDSDNKYCRYEGAGAWVSGKTYLVSVWAKASQMSGASVDLICDTQTWATITNDTNGWQKFNFQYVATVDKKFSENVLARYNNSGGTVLLDDWAIQEVVDANQVTQYHGFFADEAWLRNPERGFRYEKEYWDGTPTDTNWPNEVPQGMSLSLTYENIVDCVDQNLSPARLDQIEAMHDNLRAHDMKNVLRFAYRWGSPSDPEATIEQALTHINQLASIITNASDVIYIWQAGFAGYWGEWNNTFYTLPEKAMIVDAILDIIGPLNRKTQLRVPYYKREVLTQLGVYDEVDAANAHTNVSCAMIGYNDDGFLANVTDGGTWTEAPYYANPGNEEFDYMTKESPYVPIDGELFVLDSGVDGVDAAVRLRLQHYNSLSVYHSYEYSITNWKVTNIRIEDLRELKMPVSDNYFRNTNGNVVARNTYDYIRDHLGYRIELQRAVFPRVMNLNDTLSIEVDLINRGFAAFVNPRPVYFVLVDKNDDNVCEFEDTDADPRWWQPFEPGLVGVQVGEGFLPLLHKMKIETPLPVGINSGIYKLGLWLPDAAESIRMSQDYAVRVANHDVPWQNGINILGQINITDMLCDFDHDSDVDMIDLLYFVNHWLEPDCNGSNNFCNWTDFRQPPTVDFLDFSVLSQEWTNSP